VTAKLSVWGSNNKLALALQVPRTVSTGKTTNLGPSKGQLECDFKTAHAVNV
jgi:hypothetical protein